MVSAGAAGSQGTDYIGVVIRQQVTCYNDHRSCCETRDKK